jgi:hypothetical protein
VRRERRVNREKRKIAEKGEKRGESKAFRM